MSPTHFTMNVDQNQSKNHDNENNCYKIRQPTIEMNIRKDIPIKSRVILFDQQQNNYKIDPV